VFSGIGLASLALFKSRFVPTLSRLGLAGITYIRGPSEFHATDVSLSREANVAGHTTTMLAKVRGRRESIWKRRRGHGDMKSYELGSTTFNWRQMHKSLLDSSSPMGSSDEPGVHVTQPCRL
jgi:hypothetical protein